MASSPQQKPSVVELPPMAAALGILVEVPVADVKVGDLVETTKGPRLIEQAYLFDDGLWYIRLNGEFRSGAYRRQDTLYLRKTA